jgi:hypothetical protein
VPRTISRQARETVQVVNFGSELKRDSVSRAKLRLILSRTFLEPFRALRGETERPTGTGQNGRVTGDLGMGHGGPGDGSRRTWGWVTEDLGWVI